MRRIAAPVSAVLLISVCLVGCGSSKSAPESPQEGGAESQPAAEPPPNPTDAARPALTAEACEAGGGTVVGDIGDGAIHRPDYRCPSGAQPSANISAPGEGPMAVEGSVCCPK
jgi:hypothetical protein